MFDAAFNSNNNPARSLGEVSFDASAATRHPPSKRGKNFMGLANA
jgi:hypothetical protein